MNSWPGRSKHAKTKFGGLSRSALMSRIRSERNATTELKLISLLRVAQLRGWRRNFPLLGKPDFVFPRQKLIVFVDGCFWHGHDCGPNLKPKSNAALWQQKISGNQRRDRRVTRILRLEGWRVIRIWECGLQKSPQTCMQRIMRVLRRERHKSLKANC
jgi:DNA mismatch endonuclease (patch repair protein)